MFEMFLNEEQKTIKEKLENPADILRQNGYKIKSINPTNFGIEIQLYKGFDVDDVLNLLNGFKVKIKNNFIFIEI